FDAIESEVDGVKLRITTTKGKAESARYALEATAQILHYYNEYFGVSYPLPKLDQLAIPGGFGGAMENWGGITYYETALLFDPANSSAATKQRVYDVIAHEVAHQWFGNLVTMAWWEGTWLNEAFANLMQMKATDARRPEWKRWLAFANVEVPWAMSIDQLASTRAVEFEITSPDEVNQMFDAITYGKGSA